MRSILLAVGCAITSLSMSAQSVTYRPLEISSQLQQPLEVTSETQHPLGIASNRAHLGVASDWTQHHVLFPVSKNSAVMARLQSNPRYTQSWYLRHREIWWPGVGRGRLKALNLVHRDWSEPLGFTGPSYFITAITQSGTTVTVTTNIDHVFISGQAVMISGISAGTGGCSSAAAAAIDGVQTLTSAQGFNATFTFTSSQSATITGGECTLSTTAAAMGPTPFEPIHDFTFNVADAGTETGFGALNAVNLSDLNVLNSSATAFDVGYMATAGTLTLTNNGETGAPLETYPQLMSADNPYIFIDSLLFPNYPNTTLPFDDPGIAFTDSSLPPNEYQMLISTYMVGGVPTLELWTGWYVDGTFQKSGRGILPSTVFNNDPDGGQTWPAKYTFNVNDAPSCSGDYVAIGVPANAVAGAQANIVGYNNLYSSTGGGYCSGTGPKVLFAYASGTGEVPGSISLSTNGSQLAYIEDQLSGSSVFHVLTIGTGSEGTSPTDPATPGVGGSTALDTTLSLSGGSGSCAAQSSTTSPFIDYYDNVAYATTYAWTGAGTGTGCLYKIINVFGGTTPTIAWSVPISAVPSSPVWDTTSDNIFFTDSSGNIDYVSNTGTPSSYTPLAVAAGATSENPVTVDSTNEMVYATFNTNGSHALVAQVPITGGGTLGTAVTVPVGLGNTLFTGPYGVDFSNAWYTNGPTSAGALLYVAGTDTSTGMVPTLYNVGFNGSGVMNATANPSTPLATSTNSATTAATIADSSAVTEFFNDPDGIPADGTDYLFVGVTDSCAATGSGGEAGCVMSLNITGGAPTVSAGTTAIAVREAQPASSWIMTLAPYPSRATRKPQVPTTEQRTAVHW